MGVLLMLVLLVLAFKREETRGLFETAADPAPPLVLLLLPLVLLLLPFVLSAVFLDRRDIPGTPNMLKK